MKSIFNQNLVVFLMALSMAVNFGNAYAQQKVRSSSKQELTQQQKDMLLYIREEEKVARDVYISFYDQYAAGIFFNISESEQAHMDAIKKLLDKYGLEDPVINETGEFSDQELQVLFDSMIASGDSSLLDAYYVGALIEEVDIIDIQEAIDSADQKDLIQVYENLLRGSRNHLRSFVEMITNSGMEYQAQVLTQEEVEAILASSMERGVN